MAESARIAGYLLSLNCLMVPTASQTAALPPDLIGRWCDKGHELHFSADGYSEPNNGHTNTCKAKRIRRLGNLTWSIAFHCVGAEIDDDGNAVLVNTLVHRKQVDRETIMIMVQSVGRKVAKKVIVEPVSVFTKCD